jgi:hypothetical protein
VPVPDSSNDKAKHCTSRAVEFLPIAVQLRDDRLDATSLDAKHETKKANAQKITTVKFWLQIYFATASRWA